MHPRLAGLALVAVLVAGCGAAPSSPVSSTQATSVAPSPPAAASSPTRSAFSKPAQSTPPASATATNGCMAAMKVASDYFAADGDADLDEAERLLAKSLSVCVSAEDWLIGLREYPGAAGLTDLADLGSDSLESWCGGYPKTRVCKDAKRLGLIWPYKKG